MNGRAQQKVVLVYPNAGQDVLGINVGLPLSVLYVGTALKEAGYEVKILDQRVRKDFDARLAEAVLERPLYLGISSMTGYQIGYGLSIARAVRAVDPQVPIVWGGVHPTIHPESTLQHPLADIVIINEGEETAVELARAICSGGGLDRVAGIGFKDSGRLVLNELRPPMDLERLSWADYSLIDLNDYFTIGHISRQKQLQIVTSRGCPFRCSYCYLTLPQLRGYRWIPARRVYDEIKYLSETYGVRSIFFYDDYFFGNLKRVQEFLQLLEENPLRVQFEVSCRIDFLARQSDEFLARLARAGFTELLIGVESGSDRILKLIKKDFNREKVRQANRKLARAGIGSKMSWMAGFPGETADDFYQTADLMLELKRENPYCSLTPLGIYTPYPGTELYDRCREEFGVEFPDTLEGWSEYQWQKNNNVFLSDTDRRLLTRLNVASRFFDEKLFERFGEKRLKHLIMALYYLYGSLIRLRVRRRFFRFMPEVAVLNRLQDYYIESTHRKYLKSHGGLPARLDSECVPSATA
jgi:anaerobic magnesium-protoporphyrin IX monomethyl ester cyclase